MLDSLENPVGPGTRLMRCGGKMYGNAYKRIISVTTTSTQVISNEYCPRFPFTVVVGTSFTLRLAW
jgi:hypothetical protein